MRQRPADPAALREELIQLRRVSDLLELEFAVVASAFAQTDPAEWNGYVSPIQWMRQECGMTAAAAGNAICVGDQVSDLPRSVAAVEGGKLGFAHLAVLAGTARAIRESPQSTGFDEQPLLDQALAHGLKRFRDDCAHVRHAADAAAYLAQQHEDVSYRSLEMHTGEGGALHLQGFFDPVGGASLRAALDPLARWSGAGDGRSREQRYADALVELAGHGLDEGVMPRAGGQRPHVQVTTTLATLVGTPGAPAGTLEHAGPVASATVQRLACDASITRVLLGPESTAADVGRAHRLPSSATRRALRVRDEGCVWPGCDRPASWTAAHHLIHWAHGGPTELNNLVLLCHRHHCMVHEGGWQLIRSEDGAIVALAPMPAVEHRPRAPDPCPV
ncbi:MAG: DUF222 domain-containing protein [Candidatus Dormibacteria bacterium]